MGWFFLIFRIFISLYLNNCYCYLFIIQVYSLFSLYCLYVLIYNIWVHDVDTYVCNVYMYVLRLEDNKTSLNSLDPREKQIVIRVTLLFVNRVNIIIMHRWRMFVNNLKTPNWNTYRTAKNYMTCMTIWPVSPWTF